MPIKYLVVDKEELRSLELETYFYLQGIHNFTDRETYYNDTKTALDIFTNPDDIVVVLHVGLFWRSKQKNDKANGYEKCNACFRKLDPDAQSLALHRTNLQEHVVKHA